jgi:RNA polymerase sigma-70 factor (ECF subfamily)
MVNQSPREHTPAPYERPAIFSDVRPDGALGRLLDAAAAPAEAGPQPGEERALAAFRASRRTRRIPMFSHPTRAKAAVAATIGAGTLLFAGVGGAAAGVLPDPAQDTASTVLGELGFDVPRANEQAGDHPTQRGAEEDADETEDAGAETWVSVVRGLPRFVGDEAGWRAWVFTIGHARLRDAQRKAGRSPVPVDTTARLESEPSGDDVHARVEEIITTEAALALISRLPRTEAEVVLLRYVAGLDVAATAQVLGKKPGTVRVTAHRGLARLAELLGPDRTGDVTRSGSAAVTEMTW